MDKVKVFEPMLECFETELFKNYFKDMVKEIPDYIFNMPSSTSLKYHSRQQCDKKIGQLIHIYLFSSILNHLLKLKHNKARFSTPEYRDCLRCCPAFHDAVKCGWNGSKYTVPEHPILASKWVMNTKVKHDIPVEYKQIIADCCETHSGEFNKNRNGDVIMREPWTEAQLFIHECDILSSRNDIIWDVPDDVAALLNGVEIEPKEDSLNIKTFTMPFGKHKGKTLPQIKSEDADYIRWMKENMQNRDFYPLLKEV